MATIAAPALPPGADGGRPWPAVAALIRHHAAQQGLELRDAVVLVPYAALIDPLRAALAEAGGWQPRVETVQTLAASLGPAPEPEPGQCSGDAALDRLQAQRWLQAPAAGDEVARAQAAVLLAEAAAALADAAAQRPPDTRAAWWAAAQAALPAAADGPGALEAALLHTALAWAADAPAPASDRLFELRPAAWYGVRIGGADALADALLATASCSGLCIDLDPDADDLFAPGAAAVAPRLIEADDFEAEAWAVATEVLQALAAAEGRIALVALDRVLVRRVAALLQRCGVELDDETGWKLSTTAAAGRVLARLRAAAPQATADERLDWLKRWPPAAARPAALRALEALWRGGRNARVGAADRVAAESLWAAAQQRLQAWRHGRERRLADWLQLLGRQLDEDGDAAALQADAAGLRLLQLVQQLASGAAPAWRAALEQTHLDLAAFTRWLESLCEQTTLQRLARPHSRVVLTPLSRAVGRPFAHVVVAGLDARNLGRGSAAVSLIGDALAQRLGMPTAAERLRRQRLALAHVLRQPAATLTWRRSDGDAPLGPADEVHAVRDAWARAGRPLAVQPARVATVPVVAEPVPRPLPGAPDDLPAALSASAVDALRQCPYRFFARHVLRLGEVEELERPADKRAYGDWLHAALHRFHLERRADQDDLAALQAAADAARVELELDAAEMLPFRASLAAVLPAYLAWLAEHEAAGWTWVGGEDERTAAPPAWAPQTLRGRIDRIDRHRDGRRLLLDYKTSAADALRARVAEPLEDTQLAFYAALLGAAADAGGAAVSPALDAAYLALDDRKGMKTVVHPDVARSAQVLVECLADELRRLRAGAPLPALGEGGTCDTCEARGLCRRDFWPAADAALAVAEEPQP